MELLLLAFAGLILLGLAILFAGLLLLANYWKAQSLLDLKQLRANVRQLHARRRQAAAAAQVYDARDPEPFGSLAGQLHTCLDDVQRQLQALELHLVASNQALRLPTTNAWKNLVGSPYYQFRLRQELCIIRDELSLCEKSLQAVADLAQELGQAGQLVSQQAVRFQQLVRQITLAMDQLREHHLEGQTMLEAEHQERQALAVLEQVPAVFLGEGQGDALAGVDKGEISRVHDAITQAYPALETLLFQAQAWNTQYLETARNIMRLRRSLDSLGSILGSLLPGLNMKQVRKQFDQLKVITDTMQNTLDHMEIELMQEIGAEAANVQHASLELGSQVNQAQRQFAELILVLPQLSEGLQKLNAQCTSLASSPVHPVQWDQTRAMLTALGQQINALGQITKPREPEQVILDRAAAQDLLKRLDSLADQFQKIASQHGELLALLNSPEISQTETWRKEAQKLSEQCQAYNPENWPKVDKVSYAASELLALAEGLRRLAADPSESIPENDLAGRLDEVHQLAEFSSLLRLRMANIRSRLVEIQQVEGAAREQLASGRAAMQQISFAIRSNSFLESTAAAESSRLQANLQQLSNELDQPQQGMVDRKARQVSAGIERAKLAGNGWLQQLKQEIIQQVQTLSSSLAALDAISPLDDPAVNEARRLVTGSQALDLHGYGGPPAFTLQQLVVEFKQHCDFWQSCRAATAAVQEVEKHVSAAYTAAIEMRRRASEPFIPASQTSLVGGWLPSGEMTSAVRQEFDRLEQEWKSIPKNKTRALSLVSQLGKLTSSYQSLAEKSGQAAGQISQERARLDKLEKELLDMLDQWRARRQAYQDHPTAAPEIQALIDETQLALDQLKTQGSKGTRTYEQLLADLQKLQRKVRFYQVALDDQHAVDIHGREIISR